MTNQENNEFAIAYSERMAQENDERAKDLEELAPKIHDSRRGEWMRIEAKCFRDQAARFREMAKVWVSEVA
jgi:hypothetical protein